MEIVLDAHFDILLDVLHFRRLGERGVLERRCLPALKAAGVNVLICSVFIEETLLPEGGLRNALDQIAALREDAGDSPGCFEVCLDAKQARRAVSAGRVALFLSLEGVEPIGNDILLLRSFYDLGIRLLGLTWSRRNYAADGCAFDRSDAPARPGGLTRFGYRVVEKAQELGMVIDVSHLNDAGFEDVADLVKTPFIASHSNSRALCASARNLSDSQIKTIAVSGGVIGLNCHSPFVSDDPAGRTAEKLLAHLEYIGTLAGFEHVGLGLDLCDCLATVTPREAARRDLFGSHAEAGEKFFRAIRAGYPEDVAAMLLGGNFMRVLEKVLG